MMKAMRKFICRVGDDCGDSDIYLRMRQTLYTVFVNMIRYEQVFVVFDDDDHHHDIEIKS